MTNFVLKSISPKAAKIYGLLENHKAFTAREIGGRLGIFPNAVYRDIKDLLDIGLVELIKERPIRYKAKDKSAAMELCAAVIKQNLHDAFGLSEGDKGTLKISFFNTRKDMLKQTQDEAQKTKSRINVIISGHEIPAETFLAFKKAVDRGVKVRVLIQGQDEEMLRVARAWKKIGSQVKFISIVHARILTYDGRVTYFGSYDIAKQPEAVGVRFDYVPYANLMDEMFEQRWKMGKEI
jgi:sugar-specific transcriptional regulator TrmB